ncbi:MAG: DUF3592 domain-containing protein [Lysobacteraceae bacterium]
MFLRKPNKILLIGCVLISLFGFYGFYINARPVPEDLRSVSGVVTSAEAGQRRSRSSIHTVWFTLDGSSERFAYPGILPRIGDVWERLEVGTPVRVVYAPKPDPDDGVELWGLSSAGVEFIGPSEARDARLKNGYFALVLGVAFAGCAAYTFRQVNRGRPA